MQHVYIVSSGSHILFRLFLALCLGLALSHAVPAPCALAANGIADGETLWIDTARIEGLIHTEQETISRLLPRQLPAQFTRAEVEEFERRVRNLSLFDHVQVVRDGQVVTVEVQEKITLAPILNFTSGTSVKDLNATVGLVEYNLWGTGTQLGAQFNYSQRGPNVDVWLAQHPFEPGRWAKEIKGSYYANGIRFADSATTWTRNRFGGELELKGPYRYGSPLRYEVVMKFYRELVECVRAPDAGRGERIVSGVRAIVEDPAPLVFGGSVFGIEVIQVIDNLTHLSRTERNARTVEFTPKRDRVIRTDCVFEHEFFLAHAFRSLSEELGMELNSLEKL